jgi:hypothetical protein
MATPLTDHFQETSPRMVVMLVCLQMLRQMVDTTAQDRYLYFRGARVRRMPAIGCNQTGFLFLIHNRTLLSQDVSKAS